MVLVLGFGSEVEEVMFDKSWPNRQVIISNCSVNFSFSRPFGLT